MSVLNIFLWTSPWNSRNPKWNHYLSLFFICINTVTITLVPQIRNTGRHPFSSLSLHPTDGQVLLILSFLHSITFPFLKNYELPSTQMIQLHDILKEEKGEEVAGRGREREQEDACACFLISISFCFPLLASAIGNMDFFPQAHRSSHLRALPRLRLAWDRHVPGLIHSLTQQVFVGCLLLARFYSRSEGRTCEQHKQGPWCGGASNLERKPAGKKWTSRQVIPDGNMPRRR